MLQRDPDWFAMRAGKITGSRFGDLMAMTKSGPSTSRRNLIATLAIERITGACVDTFQNDAMRRGIELEAQARAAYEAHTGEIVDEAAFIQHPTLSYIGVSPDGLLGDDGMVELKCPAAMAKHSDALLTGSHATEYHWQIQGQLWVAGRQWVDVVSYDPRYPDGLQLAIKRIERDDKEIAKLEAACIEANREIEELVSKMLAMKEAA